MACTDLFSDEHTYMMNPVSLNTWLKVAGFVESQNVLLWQQKLEI